MTETKRKAFEVANELYNKDVLSRSDYAAIRNGLEEIETLRDRDEELEELWEKFSDVPMNPETECIENAFMGWGPGIHREKIWHWFDRRHSKGVAYLLYGDGIDRTVQTASAGMQYPELAMYNEEDHRLDLTKDDPEIDGPDYEVVFDVEDERYYCYLHGTESLLEALGLFFQDNPHITYDMIFEHMEV